LKRLKTLFEGDEARGLRELGGIIASDFTSCFQKGDIEALFLQPVKDTLSMPRHLYIAVDPNGGGMSKMGITAGYKDGNDTVVRRGGRKRERETRGLWGVYCVSFPCRFPFPFPFLSRPLPYPG